jgi:hypothetical protein
MKTFYWRTFVINSPQWFKMQYNLSQEEIDAIVKELKDGYESIPAHNKEEIEKKIETKSNCVFHEWIPYLGLNESFDHCKLCGEKRK